MRREATAEFVTKFTGDLSDIVTKVQEYERQLDALAQGHKRFSKDVDVSIKQVGDTWNATVDTTATATLRQLENVKALNVAARDVGSGFKEMGLAVSGVAGSFANFGHIIANLQMPMIWIQWREEQLMVTTRRIRELTQSYTESLRENGAASNETRRALGQLNEAKTLAAVYTQRMERAEFMMNLAYITTIADIFPAFIRLSESINALRKLTIFQTIAETVATWNLTAAKSALATVTGALAPYMVPLMVAGALAVGAAVGYGVSQATPKTAQGQYGGVVERTGWAYIHEGETLSRGQSYININVNGSVDPRGTATEIRKVLDEYFNGRYRARGMV